MQQRREHTLRHNSLNRHHPTWGVCAFALSFSAPTHSAPSQLRRAACTLATATEAVASAQSSPPTARAKESPPLYSHNVHMKVDRWSSYTNAEDVNETCADGRRDVLEIRLCWIDKDGDGRGAKEEYNE